MALTNSDINKIGNLVDRKLDIQKEELLDQMDVKLNNLKSEFFDRVDPVLKEVMANREDRTIMAHYITELRARVEKDRKTAWYDYLGKIKPSFNTAHYICTTKIRNNFVVFEVQY